MKNYNKNKDSLYLIYLDANNLYGWAMSQKLPEKTASKFNKKGIRNYDEDSDKGYIFSKYMLNTLK